MNDRRFQSINKQEFEQALAETDLDFEEVNYDWSGELIYEAKSGEGVFTLRVYSSLNKYTGEAREKGSDAIRTIVLHSETGRPVLKEKRTNRIKTWRKNLKKKIENITRRHKDVEICDKCSEPMVIRTNEDDEEFLGCSSYPECKNTKSLD
jgi:hypothetical protein